MIEEITLRELDAGRFIEEKVAEIRAAVGEGTAINALSGGVDSSVVTMLGHRALGLAAEVGLHRERADARGRARAGRRPLPGTGRAGRDRRRPRGVLRARSPASPIRRRSARRSRRPSTRRSSGASCARAARSPCCRARSSPTSTRRWPASSASTTSSSSWASTRRRPSATGSSSRWSSCARTACASVGRALGLPAELFNRIPFPGPALAARVIGEATPERIETVRAGHGGRRAAARGRRRLPVHGHPARGPGDRHARRQARVRPADRGALLGQRGRATGDARRSCRSTCCERLADEILERGARRGQRHLQHRHQAAVDDRGGLRISATHLRETWLRAAGIPLSYDAGPYLGALREVEAVEVGGLSDAALGDRAARAREAARAGRPLDALLPEVFAIAREASARLLGLRPFDVQVAAGVALHRGRLAQLATGEGKTLVAVMPAILNALEGPRRPRLHRQRLPRRARRPVDGAGLPLLRPYRGVRRPGLSRDEARASRLRGRRHVRHGERGRVRLPARPHGRRRRRPGAAPPPPRHRGRSRLHPDRRGAGAAGDRRRDAAPRRGPRGGRRGRAIAGARHGLRRGRVRADGRAHRGRLPHASAAARRGPLVARPAPAAEQPCTSPCTRSSSSTATATTSSATAASSWWTSSPAGWPTTAGGRTASSAAVEAKEGVRLSAEGRILGSIPIQHFVRLYPRLAGMTATAAPAAEEFKAFFGLATVVFPPHRALHPGRRARRGVHSPGGEDGGAGRGDRAGATRAGDRCSSARRAWPSPRSSAALLRRPACDARS